MGGGVSLGSFCGSSMTEAVKLLILFGRYKKVEIDAFSGASAGSLSLAIMMRYLACLPQELVSKAVAVMLSDLEQTMKAANQHSHSHSPRRHNHNKQSAKKEIGESNDGNDGNDDNAEDVEGQKADEKMFAAVDVYVQKFSEYAATADKHSFDSDKMEMAKAAWLSSQASKKQNPTATDSGSESQEAKDEEPPLWFPDQWLHVLCERARLRLAKQLGSLVAEGFKLTRTPADGLHVEKACADINIFISNDKLQDALAVQVVQEVGSLSYCSVSSVCFFHVVCQCFICLFFVLPPV